MELKPVFEKINLEKFVGEVDTTVKTETKTDVFSDGVKKILGVSAFAGVREESVTDGQIKFSGRIIYYVSYVDDGGALKKCECGSEFVGNAEPENVREGCRVKLSVETDKTDADLSGAKLSVFSTLTVKAEIYENEEINALSGGNGVVLNSAEREIVKGYGNKKGAYPVEEEFELDYAVAEVLSHKATAVITAVQCGVGCIIVDGEVYLTAILLQSGEKNDIIREDKIIPFRMEIDCEEAMPSMSATASVGEKSFKTDIAVDAESGKSTVTASVTLQFEGEAYSTETVSVADDVFSTGEELQTTFGECAYCKPHEPRIFHEKISGRAETEELPIGARYVVTDGEKIEIISTSCSENGVKITGVLSVNAYLKNDDGYSSVKLQTPFETTLAVAKEECCSVKVKGLSVKSSVRMVSLTVSEIEADVDFTVVQAENRSVKYIKEIKSVGEKPECDCAISVYIPTEGEELWSLAKRLNVCPDSLIATNKDLQFPLTGKERIVVYRQK